jgi:hypothetical protein
METKVDAETVRKTKVAMQNWLDERKTHDYTDAEFNRLKLFVYNRFMSTNHSDEQTIQFINKFYCKTVDNKKMKKS